METNEKIIFKNTFGIITDKRVTLNYKRGMEDIPINKITSVSYLHIRSYFISIGGFLLCAFGLITMLININEIDILYILFTIIIATIGFLLGIAGWIGHHLIILSLGGKDRKPLKVEMSKTQEGRDFVKAVKRTIIS